MKYGLGTDEASYNQTDYIRLNAELFFRNAIARVRKGEAFQSGEHILDIGCGREGFFRKVWENVTSVKVTGVEKKPEDSGRPVEQEPDRRIVVGDFFEVSLPEGAFDVVHASYAMTWMMSPRDGVENVGELFWSRVRSLIRGNGWFLAHHPGNEDYFPDYNKLILDSLSKIGHDFGDPSKYWNERRKFVSPPRIADLRKQCTEAKFRIHLLANSLEWIPIKVEDYFAYWESGGKSWLMEALNNDAATYERFKGKILETIQNDKQLSELGISMFELGEIKYILSPSWHQYVIAQKCGSEAECHHGPHVSWKSINAPLQAHALARMNVETNILESAYELSQNIYSADEHIAYLALIEAMGKPKIKNVKFHDDYLNRQQWINDGGSRFNLCTFTSVLSDLIASTPTPERPPIGIIGTITDQPVEAIDILMLGEALSSSEKDALHYVFCWPENTLNNRSVVNLDAQSVNLGCDLIIDSITSGSSDWPRLFFQSDVALKALYMMASSKGEFSTFIEPLRYFDWQTRVTAPYPQSFLLATTLVRGVNGDPESLPSLFGMVARTSRVCVTATEILSDAIALQLLLALGTGEMSKAMVNALAKSKEEEMDLRRSHDMLLKLQRPLDALTDAFDSVRAEAQEMQAMLNDPEEGVFRAHKALAPLFQQGHSIQISQFLSVDANHGWSPNEPLEDLQAAYCHALTCIFGIQKRTFDAPSHVAFVEKTRDALRDKREAGVNSKLIELLSRLCGWADLYNHVGSSEEIENSVRRCCNGGSKPETDDEMRLRFSNALNMLKRVAFTPFKSFGREWPFAPVQIAALTMQVTRGKEEVDKKASPVLSPQDTPFSQHAVLSFIIGLKSEIAGPRPGADAITKLGHGRIYSDIKNDKGGTLAEYRLEITRFFFGRQPYEDLGIHQSTLQDCIRSTIRYGIAGKVMGSFLGIFQDLLRHGINLATSDDYSEDSWVLLEPPAPTWKRAILLVLGKANADRLKDASALNKFCESSGKTKRYFAIVQEQIPDQSGNYCLRIIWSDKKADVLQTPLRPQATAPVSANSNTDANTEHAEDMDLRFKADAEAGKKVETLPVTNQAITEWPDIVCIDHNSAWYLALNKISFLTVRLKSQNFSEIDGFNPCNSCVVVLHGNPAGETNSALSWKSKLAQLIGENKVLRVIVASAGGHPKEKGIPEDDRFIWGVLNTEGIHVSDLQDSNSAKRNHFLSLIQEGKV